MTGWCCVSERFCCWFCYVRVLCRGGLGGRAWGVQGFESWWIDVRRGGRISLAVGRVNILQKECWLILSSSTAGLKDNKRKRFLHIQAVGPYQLDPVGPPRLRPSDNTASSLLLLSPQRYLHPSSPPPLDTLPQSLPATVCA